MISTKKLLYKVCDALNKTTIVSKSSVSSLPTTITDSKILADMVCIKAVLSNPAAQTADWTVTTSAGSAVISGTSAISGTTDIELYLMRS